MRASLFCELHSEFISCFGKCLHLLAQLKNEAAQSAIFRITHEEFILLWVRISQFRLHTIFILFLTLISKIERRKVGTVSELLECHCVLAIPFSVRLRTI